ncbi:MAG: autotransporter domain-containing protein [Pseudolabrys sp.]
MECTLGWGRSAAPAYTLTPSLQVRYVHAAFDGYTESGSTAKLTVGDRSTGDFEERGQLSLACTQAFAPDEALRINIFGGLLADQRAGSTTINATLLGQAIPFATPGNDSVRGGFGGAGPGWRSGRVTLVASVKSFDMSIIGWRSRSGEVHPNLVVVGP